MSNKIFKKGQYILLIACIHYIHIVSGPEQGPDRVKGRYGDSGPRVGQGPLWRLHTAGQCTEDCRQTHKGTHCMLLYIQCILFMC